MSPYSKMQAGWLVPIEITVDGYYPVQPSEISSQVYKISKNYPEGEFVSEKKNLKNKKKNKK
jgi:hypothetical protein